jgi:preprotein translocase subunit YajC
MKEHKNLMSALAKGDEVLTQGGLIGRISKIADDKDFVAISLNDTTEVTVQKGAITAVLPKGTLKSL